MNRSSANTNLSYKHVFNAQALFASPVVRRVIAYRRSEKVFSQGDPVTDVLYIQKGDMKLSVANEVGKKAVVAILGPGDFLGEACLFYRSVHRETAVALSSATVIAIQKKEMVRMLRTERGFASLFIGYTLKRNIRIEEALIDQLFNFSEKRLARALLQLSHYGKEEGGRRLAFKVSHEVLAEMIGVTRSHVSFFMKKFRTLGFIGYDGGLHINPSLLNVYLHEEEQTVTRYSLASHGLESSPKASVSGLATKKTSI